MDISVIEQVKIQAEILVPLVKVLQAELGEEHANALVRKALGNVYRRLGEQWWRAKESRHVGETSHRRGLRSPKVTPLTTVSVRNRKIHMRSMSPDAGTRSSTRSWVSLNLGSCWSAAWTFRSPRVLAQT